jgi:isopentenyldiphosphate isomerase
MFNPATGEGNLARRPRPAIICYANPMTTSPRDPEPNPAPASRPDLTPDAVPEILEVFDPDGHSLGTKTRAEAEDGGHTIQNALAFIFDSTGRVWIQQRHHTKKHFPSLWDISVCGAVHHDETPLQAAHREQSEELGYTCDLEHVTSFLNVFPQTHGSTDTYRRLSHLYIGVSDLQPQLNDEVEAFDALPYADLRADVVAHPEKYVPPFLTELDMAIKAYKASPLSRQPDSADPKD